DESLDGRFSSQQISSVLLAHGCPLRLVDHVLRSTFKIIAHYRAHWLLNANLVDSSEHVLKPVQTKLGINRKRRMAHPQAGMPPFLPVLLRSAEKLAQKEKLPALSRFHVFWKD